jgi:hypothetical protein
MRRDFLKKIVNESVSTQFGRLTDHAAIAVKTKAIIRICAELLTFLI